MKHQRIDGGDWHIDVKTDGNGDGWINVVGIDDPDTRTQITALEWLVLQHAIEGVNIEETAYANGVTATVNFFRGKD